LDLEVLINEEISKIGKSNRSDKSWLDLLSGIRSMMPSRFYTSPVFAGLPWHQ
jgi:hypothetical protein